jgi:hypothetical protein
VVITDSEGTAVRRNTGDTVVHEVKDGEDPDTSASIQAATFTDTKSPGSAGPSDTPGRPTLAPLDGGEEAAFIRN